MAAKDVKFSGDARIRNSTRKRIGANYEIPPITRPRSR